MIIPQIEVRLSSTGAADLTLWWVKEDWNTSSSKTTISAAMPTTGGGAETITFTSIIGAQQMTENATHGIYFLSAVGLANPVYIYGMRVTYYYY